MHLNCFVRVLCVAFVAAGCLAAASIPAFPGAEGYGALTPGGRGGQTRFVTNLNDSGPGSLRAALNSPGRRTILFRVSGTIELKSSLNIKEPFLTLAGQSAPGDGICLKNYPLSIDTHDVIIRYLRFRLGDLSKTNSDSLGGRRCKNIIIDHCSASWSIDECVSFYNNENITIQWCLIAESLYQSQHAKGRHGYGGIWGGSNSSLHHNLLAHHSSRNPRFASRDQNIDYRNNVIYNWGFNSAYGGEGATANIIANYYKPGPATAAKVKSRIVEPYPTTRPVTSRWFISDNIMEGSPTVSADNWTGVHTATSLATIRADKPFPSAPVATHTAQQAYDLVLSHAGATLPKRDSLDARIVNEVRTATATYGETFAGGKKGIIDSQQTVGGWPTLNSAPAPFDSDNDGLPDDWEKKHNLNPNDPADALLDSDSDGYTNLEEYLNNTNPHDNQR
ncbi:MAG: pectate lyase [Planctomycetota bacterium]|nr:pectate lyase [Planctomycetota bacterium]